MDTPPPPPLSSSSSSSSSKKDNKNHLFHHSNLLSKNSNKTLTRRLKLYTEEEQLNKLSIENILEKTLLLSKDKLWKQYEIIFYTNILTNKQINNLKNNTNNNNNSSNNNNNIELYLLIFFSIEQSTGYCVIISIKGKDIEFKQSWNLMEIKRIKFGTNLNEFIVTVDEDYSWRTISNLDRDEIVWVLIHVCQYLCDNDIKSKGIELQHLSTAISTKGTLNKFTILKKLLEENMDDMNPYTSGDMLSFTPEEADAEKLFDELQWGTTTNTTTSTSTSSSSTLSSDGNSDPAILQKKLKTESDVLHVEICDFLLQWEDDDLIGHSIAMGELKSSQEYKLNSNVSNSSSRETLEMLTVLTQVDQELKLVDEWLKKQVNYLSTVQKELFQIEAENSTLETSWHNLTAVKTMITSLLNGPLSLASDLEVDLRSPVNIVRAALFEDKELKNTSTILSRLITALESLRNGLNLIEGNDPSFDPNQWERIQTMSVITHQRNKLIELSDIVCNSLTDLVSNLFKTLLQHKALTDPNPNTSQKNRTIIVRKFSFSSITNRVKEQQGRYLVSNEDETNNNNNNVINTTTLTTATVATTTTTTTGNNNPSTTTLPTQLSSRNMSTVNSSSVVYGAVTNQILNAQQVYHNAILPFIPLLENLAALSPTLSEILNHSYIEATEAYLYTPLCKDLFRDLLNSIPSRQTPIFTLQSAPKSLARKMTNPSLRFQHPSMCRSGTPLVVTSWTVFSIAIKLIEEVASQEKFFLSQVLFFLLLYHITSFLSY